MSKAIIHLLVPAADGPIRSAGVSRKEDRRYVVACSPTSPLPNHATGEASAATCPLCLASDAGKAVAEAQKPGESEIDKRAREALEAMEAAGCDACENG